MVKSKEIKVLRKKLAKVEQLANPIERIDGAVKGSLHWEFHSPSYPLNQEDPHHDFAGDNGTLLVEYSPSVDLPDYRFRQVLDLFERNMGDLYRGSSWGLDLQQKTEELKHRKARFLFVLSPKSFNIDKDDIKENSNYTDRKDNNLIAFVHFRFCYDDDDSPSNIVLYLYEIQVETLYQRCGLGQRLMRLLESIAQTSSLPKIMLTCFKNNTKALGFYMNSLSYEIDKSSPSQYGEKEEYEILSKRIVSRDSKS